MLERNLLYTGLTRARKLAWIIGDYAAISRAIANAATEGRRTMLAERIAALLPSPTDHPTDEPSVTPITRREIPL